MTIGSAWTAVGIGLLVSGLIAGCAPAPTVTAGSGAPLVSPAGPSAVVGPSGTPVANDAEVAGALADRYERALVNGEWEAAWDMLSPVAQAFRGTLAEYTTERSAYFRSVDGRYTLSTPTRGGAVLGPSTTSPDLLRGADLSRAFVVEADYPALAGNNAGYEIFLVAPDASGAWRIWPLR